MTSKYCVDKQLSLTILQHKNTEIESPYTDFATAPLTTQAKPLHSFFFHENISGKEI